MPYMRKAAGSILIRRQFFFIHQNYFLLHFLITIIYIMPFDEYFIIIFNKNSFFRIIVMSCIENRTFY